MTARIKVPRFKSEAQERSFWEARDSAELIDWSKAKRVRLPNLKPSTRSISLRLPVHTLPQNRKVLSNPCDVERRQRFGNRRSTIRPDVIHQ